MGLNKIAVLLYSLSLVAASPTAVFKKTTTPDNTCGATSAGKYTCNPADPLGGACCSASGYCGNSDAYCGSGCQSAYGSCGTSSGINNDAGLYNVEGVGSFKYTKTFTFTGSGLPAGLRSSNWDVHDAPPASCGHTFNPANVVVAGGALQLKVPGGQTCSSSSMLSSAEVTTDLGDIKYASVRTTAMLTDVAGTCNGFFFYKSDRQELDIEYLSDPTSTSNPRDGSKPMHYTNQAVDGDNSHKTYGTAPSPSDATTAYHEYRIDWIPGKTIYYLDGEPQKTFTDNVPTERGVWIWNNWANGDQGWTGAPPKTDSVLKIQQIVMYYNTSST